MDDDSLIAEQSDNIKKISDDENKANVDKPVVSDDKPTDLKKDVEDITLESINKKKEELVDIEKRVDLKLTQLRDIVEETKREGRGVMIAKPKEKTKEELLKEDANKIMNTFGYGD